MLPGYVSEGDYDPFCCACRVSSISPKKTGNGDLELEAWVTGYAEGVNKGTVPLRVLFRGDSYLVAQILYPEAPQVKRCVVLSELTLEWLERFDPPLWRHVSESWTGEDGPDEIQNRTQRFFSPSIS